MHSFTSSRLYPSSKKLDGAQGWHSNLVPIILRQIFTWPTPYAAASQAGTTYHSVST